MELRLFPLGQVVLFPGMPLPLQVFEPRYRQLVAECLQHDEPFGVVLIREGTEVGGDAEPHEVGTTARITSAENDDNGVIQLRTVGERRFRIVTLYHDRAYLYADIEYLEDIAADIEPARLEQARAGFRRISRLQAAPRGEFEREPPVPAGAGALTDAIATFAAVDIRQRQRLLETADVAVRLDTVLPLLDEAIAVIAARSAEAVAARWSGFGAAN